MLPSQTSSHEKGVLQLEYVHVLAITHPLPTSTSLEVSSHSHLSVWLGIRKILPSNEKIFFHRDATAQCL